MRKLFLVFIVLLLVSCNTETNNNQINKSRQNSEKEIVARKQSPPIMGWASWNNFRTDINEELIKSQADAMVSSGLKEVGYSFINIDDGFFGGRDESGNLLFHKQRFPNGIKILADYIHAKGLKAGIYSDAGINTCASYWDNDTAGIGVGLYGYDKKDLQLLLKEYDFDFIKVDWCGGEWLGLDEQLRYTEIGKQIQSIKPEVIYNVCRWQFPGKWITQLADSWRISGDISSDFQSILSIIDLNADLWMYASEGHYNDMDMLQVGRGMSYEEDKTHFTFWCMMQSPLLLGNDLTQMNQQTIDIITNEDIIALNQSFYVYQARRLVDYGDLEVWGKPLISAISGEVAVALLNRSEKAAKISFSIESVGLDASKGYTIQDLWTKETFPVSTENVLIRDVAAHGVVILKMVGKSLPYNVFQFKDRE